MIGPLAVSLGDPAGVGPELICEAWTRREEERLPPFFVCGGAGVLHAAAAERGIALPIARVANPGEAHAAFESALPVLGGGDVEYRPGVPSEPGAFLALASLTDATALAASGEAGGVVTGPVSKARLAEVGFEHPGQTEFVAQGCGVQPDEAVMMLAGPNLRTVPVTVHIALSSVPQALTSELIVRKAWTVARALRADFGIAEPRIAIAALNPHAGEEGKFGDEEERVIRPAMQRLLDRGVVTSGPHPADTLFAPRMRTTFDVAICMYHDQALVPLKALDFDHGVNVTLGLRIVRTSPDHGTAFGIAGKGIADPGAMIAALRMAGEMATRRAAA
jgi:4-hydroxythreonine-4-phosphate dehydrogenase